MSNFLKKSLALCLVSAGFFSFLFIIDVGAQSWLPPFIEELVGSGNDVTLKIADRARVFFVILFAFVVIIAVWYTILASIKYIRSQGEAGEIENSQKAVQAVLVGIAILFIGLMGIAVVLLFFESALSWFVPHSVCIEYPEGAGCYACQNQGSGAIDNATGRFENELACQRCNAYTRQDGIDVAARDGYEISQNRTGDGGTDTLTSISCNDDIYEFPDL